MKTKHLINYLISRVVLVLVAGVLLPLLTFAAELPDALLTMANPRVQEVMKVQEEVTSDLMAIEEILGTAVGLDAQGQLALVVYVNVEGKNPGEVVRALPPKLRGMRVSAELTEPFRALIGKPGGGGGGGVSHTAKQSTPIQLGTSGGWGGDLANGYCCGGTLGSLVEKGGAQYILSNYHVFESDIVNGGNGRVATLGDPVIQPGLIDVNCNASSAQNVATLVKLSSLPGSNVDCSIAQVLPGMVDPLGSILEIETISRTTVAAFLNQGVKKSGRTTGLTRSVVSGLNASVSVAYENECAGGAAFTKTYAGQIIIKNQNRGKSFIDGGDSGSLMVEDAGAITGTPRPRAVGLLFAGSSTIAVANPIDEVLIFVGEKLGGTVTMVGGQ